MGIYIVKTLLSAIIIVLVSELAKTMTWFAALITSLPIVSIIAITWLYVDTHDISKVSAYSIDIFYLVIPSLIFFIVLPLLLKNGVSFWISLPASCLITAAGYGVYVMALSKLGTMS